MSERFWSKVDKGASCWPYRGYIDNLGYGIAGYNSRRWKAHRLAYFLTHGAIPEGAHILHSCDNPACCNPAHLRAGTHAENMRDKAERGRDYNVKKTRCINGHAFDETNTYIRPNGNRACKACQLDRKRAYRLRLAERKAS